MRYTILVLILALAVTGTAQPVKLAKKKAAPSVAGGYKAGMKLTYAGPGESFSFTDNKGGSITISQSNTLVNFPGIYRPGDTIAISQTAGPRAVNFLNNSHSGIFLNSNFIATAESGAAPGQVVIKGILDGVPGARITLQNNGTDDITVTAAQNSVRFAFPKPLAEGTPYKVTIKSAPEGQRYVVSNYSGEPGIASANSFIKIYGDKEIDLVSRGNGDSILGTFYESWDACVDKAIDDKARFVVFVSQAKGLCGSTGKYRQIFWRDRQTGETRMISRSPGGEEGNGNSFAPVISVGSIYVAFESYASNLVTGDGNGVRDVFLWRKTQAGGEIERVSVSQNGMEGNSESFEPSISGMGGHVAFSSNASNLLTDGTRVDGVNVYLWEKNNKNITLISKDPKTGIGVGGSRPSIDMNGYKIAFWSFAYTLVPNDNNNLWDIFLYERNSGMVGLPLKRITMAYDGGERNQGDESSSRVVTPTISGMDGRFITYATTATNVVPNDNNKAQDVFVYDSQTGITTRASVNNNGEEGDGDSPIGQGEEIPISANGDIVAFTTKASNFGTPANNVVLYNLQTRKMIPVSSVKGTYVSTPSLSRNGRYVSFGCGQPLDKRFGSSGLFVALTGW
ncbi:MAG: hypothetical protein JNM19_02775 [Chitinophagaceae bacterium]|nr:hypothetical protein [Chitinophagaceae bacterium]